MTDQAMIAMRETHMTYASHACFLLVFLLSASDAANAQSWSPFAPDNYEECILQGMKGVASESAAVAVKEACHRQFPISCEVYFEDGRFKKGGKRLLQASRAFIVSFTRGVEVRAWLPEALAEKSDAERDDFLANHSEEIKQVCGLLARY